MESYRELNKGDQERLLEELDPMSHDIWQKPMEGSMSFDIGEGKDKSIVTLFEIGENGEYRPIEAIDSISFGSDVAHSGYVGVEAGEYTLSLDAANKTLEYLTGLRVEYERLTDTLDKIFKSWNGCNIMMCRLLDRFKGMKCRKTTYRTIRRDCAKRNRHK